MPGTSPTSTFNSLATKHDNELKELSNKNANLSRILTDFTKESSDVMQVFADNMGDLAHSEDFKTSIAPAYLEQGFIDDAELTRRQQSAVQKVKTSIQNNFEKQSAKLIESQQAELASVIRACDNDPELKKNKFKLLEILRKKHEETRNCLLKSTEEAIQKLNERIERAHLQLALLFGREKHNRYYDEIIFKNKDVTEYKKDKEEFLKVRSYYQDQLVQTDNNSENFFDNSKLHEKEFKTLYMSKETLFENNSNISMAVSIKKDEKGKWQGTFKSAYGNDFQVYRKGHEILYTMLIAQGDVQEFDLTQFRRNCPPLNKSMSADEILYFRNEQTVLMAKKLLSLNPNIKLINLPVLPDKLARDLADFQARAQTLYDSRLKRDNIPKSRESCDLTVTLPGPSAAAYGPAEGLSLNSLDEDKQRKGTLSLTPDNPAPDTEPRKSRSFGK